MGFFDEDMEVWDCIVVVLLDGRVLFIGVLDCVLSEDGI